MKSLYDKEGLTREIRVISDAIINLYAAHVNSFLYPYDHPLVSDSLRNAYNCLQKCLDKKPVVTLDVSESGIAVDGQAIGDNLLVFRNIALWLSSNRIMSLSFADGLTRRELTSFHKVISVKGQSAEELPGALLEKSVANITVRLFGTAPSEDSDFDLSLKIATRGLIKDYMSNMFYAGEPERTAHPSSETIKSLVLGNTLDAEGTERGAVAAGTSPVHDAFARGSVEDTTYQHAVEKLLERGVPDADRMLIRSIPPLEMAHLMNAMLFKSPAKDVVSRVVAAYFGEDGALPGEDTAERGRIFYKGLKSALKASFMAIIPLSGLDGLDGHTEDASVLFREDAHRLSVIKESGQDQILGPYSPLVRRMVRGCDFAFDFIAEDEAVIHDIGLRGDTQLLFQSGCPGRSCPCVEPDVLPGETVATKAAYDRSAAGFIEECSGDIILDYSFNVLLEILETEDLEQETLANLSRRLTALLELFVEKGDFEKVLDIHNALKAQSLRNTSSCHASSVLKGIFSQDHLLTRIVTALRQHGRRNRASADMVTKALRSYLVPHLLDALSVEEETSRRRFIISLLISIRGDVLPHVVARLRDSRWYVLRNMLLLLRECHGRSHAGDVQDFLHHEVPLVRLEALRTLLRFHDPAAVPALLEMFRAENEYLQRGASLLAGSYRIREAIPSLVMLLREKDRMGKRIHLKKSIVRSLGRIGDSKALPHLLHLCRSSSMINKEQFEALRGEIFRTLYNYPIGSVKAFIDYGLESDNKAIAGICRKLMDRYQKSVAR